MFSSSMISLLLKYKTFRITFKGELGTYWFAITLSIKTPYKTDKEGVREVLKKPDVDISNALNCPRTAVRSHRKSIHS